MQYLTFVLFGAAGALGGALWGLIPYFIARRRGHPVMGDWALLWCTVSGLLSGGILLPPVLIAFILIAAISTHDFKKSLRRGSTPVQQFPQQPSQPVIVQTGLQIICLAGPIKGQTYALTSYGLMFGRDMDCNVRFPDGQAGISRHHCALRWQQGVPVLVDLSSSYGTFLGNGTRLPPNYPTTVAPGTRFYLGNSSILFQVTAI